MSKSTDAERSSLVFDARLPANEPQTHALVIGVGGYAYLPGGSKFDYARSVPTFGMKNLTSPPVSARAFASWLCGLADQGGYSNPSARLGTIDLLLSPAGAFVDHNGIEKAVDCPDMPIIKAAYSAWFRRCNANPSNVALFYFCGHGLASGFNSLLLSSDYGKDSLTLADSLIDLNQTMQKTSACQAFTQCYFIDACRNTTGDYHLEGQALGPSVSGSYPVRDYLLIRSALVDQSALGQSNDVSVFTAALLRCLRDGLGAEGQDQNGSGYAVTTQSLRHALERYLPRQRLADGMKAPACDPYCPLPANPDHSTVLHVASDALVMVTVTCAPQEADELATITMRHKPPREFTRKPGAGTWELDVPTGTYDVEALFASGYEKQQWTQQQLLHPYRNIRIQAKTLGSSGAEAAIEKATQPANRVKISFGHSTANVGLTRVAAEVLDSQGKQVWHGPLQLSQEVQVPLPGDENNYLVRVQLPSGSALDTQIIDADGRSILETPTASPWETMDWAYYIQGVTRTGRRTAAEDIIQFAPGVRSLSAALEVNLWELRESKAVLLSKEQSDILKDLNLPEDPHLLAGFQADPKAALLLFGVSDKKSAAKFVVLPPGGNTRILVALDTIPAVPGDPFHLVVHGSDAQAEALLAYLSRSDLRSARDVCSDVIARAHATADSPSADPSTALIAGYYLFLETRGRALPPPWLLALPAKFPWLSDGLVLEAAFALWADTNRGVAELARAGNLLILAARRGLPCYTIGLRLLSDGLDAVAAHTDLVTEELQAIRAKIHRYAEACDWRVPHTTYIGDHHPELPLPFETAVAG